MLPILNLPVDIQELVRELIVETDHLSRTSHDAGDHTRSGRLAALRSTFQRLDRALGGGSARFALAGELDVAYQRVRDLVSGVQDDAARPDLARLLEHAERLRALRPTMSRGAKAPLPLPPIAREGSAGRRAPGLLRWVAAALGLGALAALGFAFARPRRSRTGWGVSAAL